MSKGTGSTASMNRMKKFTDKMKIPPTEDKDTTDGFAEFKAEVNALNPTSKTHTANEGKQIKFGDI
jgi:hypothetical protein